MAQRIGSGHGHTGITREQIPGTDVQVLTGPWSAAYGILYPNADMVVFVGWTNSSYQTRKFVNQLRGYATQEARGKPDYEAGQFVVRTKTSHVPEIVGSELVVYEDPEIAAAHDEDQGALPPQRQELRPTSV